MGKYSQLDTTLPTVSAEKFYSQYIAQRRPVIVKGLLDDEAFKGRSWVRMR